MTRTKLSTRQLVAVFHALSDETRLAIVRRLASGEKCVCELQDLLDSAQSRLSYHLKLLKDAGLITDRKEGRWVHYALVPHAMDFVVDFMEDMDEAAHESRGFKCC